MAEGRVGVVGGGLAGLTAATELKRRGYQVELFERSRLVGGKATSFEIEGIEVDNGQHVFLACCEQFIQFVREIGLSITGDSSDPIYLQPRFEALLVPRAGRAVRLTTMRMPPPLHLLPALLASRHLGITGRLQITLGLLALKRGTRPGESFRRWLERHLQGRRSIQGFWDPFVVPALNASLEEVAAAEAAFVIETAFLNDTDSARFGYTRVPLGRIAQKAIEPLDVVRLRTAVTGLEKDGVTDRRVGVSTKPGGTQWFDGVVLAVPPERLKAILDRPKEWGIFGLDQFAYAAIVDVHLWYDLPPRTLFDHLDFAALLDSPIQWVFEKPAPKDETYLVCSMSAAGSHAGETKEALVAMAHGELVDRFPILRQAKLLRGAATRDRDATFVPSVGLLRPGPQTTSPRVTLAGAWTDTGWPATMESAVRSGMQAAEVLDGAIAA